MDSPPAFPARDVQSIATEVGRVYRNRIVRLLSISLVSVILTQVAAAALVAVLPAGPQAEIDQLLLDAGDDTAAIQAAQEEIGRLLLDNLPLVVASTVLLIAAGLIVAAVVGGAYVYVIGGHYVQGRVSLRDAFAYSIQRVGRMVAATLLAGLAVLAIWSMLFLIPLAITIAVSANQVLAALLSLLVIAGFLGAVGVSIYLVVRWTFVWQAVILEGLSPLAALTRSWELVEGYWWRTFGIIVIAAIGYVAVSGLWSFLLAILGWVVFFDLELPGAAAWATGQIRDLMPIVLYGPVQMLVAVILYTDMRTRKEQPGGYAPAQMADALHMTPSPPTPPAAMPDDGATT